jgi:hypothetical protein
MMQSDTTIIRNSRNGSSDMTKKGETLACSGISTAHAWATKPSATNPPCRRRMRQPQTSASAFPLLHKRLISSLQQQVHFHS